MPLSHFSRGRSPSNYGALSNTAVAKGEPCYCEFFSGLLAALGINGALLILAATRARWLPCFAPFRAVHLSPLNPEAGGMPQRHREGSA